MGSSSGSSSSFPSSSASSSSSTGPLSTSLHGPPGSGAPPTCEVPHFAPLRVGGARYQLRRLARHRRRAVAAGLAVTAAALVAAGPRGAEPAQNGQRARGHPMAEAVPERRRAVEMVAAPVRIADGATVRLLRPGNRVDVIAAEESSTNGGGARVVARGARVTRVPAASATESGALVVLTVPRATAPRLAGAGATSRLAVTLCRP
ncbi:hypothetical protein [Streptomyces acidicola]|uniref:hypothetical protein n=1 Tax=Streptomyces acidicola TaxID=2596892 RepID=UPI003F4DB371